MLNTKSRNGGDSASRKRNPLVGINRAEVSSSMDPIAGAGLAGSHPVEHQLAPGFADAAHPNATFDHQTQPLALITDLEQGAASFDLQQRSLRCDQLAVSFRQLNQHLEVVGTVYESLLGDHAGTVPEHGAPPPSAG
jgi:hypothetical protein